MAALLGSLIAPPCQPQSLELHRKTRGGVHVYNGDPIVFKLDPGARMPVIVDLVLVNPNNVDQPTEDWVTRYFGAVDWLSQPFDQSAMATAVHGYVKIPVPRANAGIPGGEEHPYRLATRVGETGPRRIQSRVFYIHFERPWEREAAARRSPEVIGTSASLGTNRWDLWRKAEERGRRATVNVLVKEDQERGLKQKQGTGFIWNSLGHVVTAAHTVADCVKPGPTESDPCGRPESGPQWTKRKQIVVTLNEQALIHAATEPPTRDYRYRMLGEPFPSDHELEGQLAVLVPERSIPFDGSLPFWLEPADLDREARVLLFKPSHGRQMLMAGWPAGKRHSTVVRVDVDNKESDRIEAAVYPGDLLFSPPLRSWYLTFTSHVYKPGWSGSPIYDPAGRVWGVGVQREEEFSRGFAHWAYDIYSQYRAWDKDGTLKTQVMRGAE